MNDSARNFCNLVVDLFHHSFCPFRILHRSSRILILRSFRLTSSFLLCRSPRQLSISFTFKRTVFLNSCVTAVSVLLNCISSRSPKSLMFVFCASRTFSSNSIMFSWNPHFCVTIWDIAVILVGSVNSSLMQIFACIQTAVNLLGLWKTSPLMNFILLESAEGNEVSKSKKHCNQQ